MPRESVLQGSLQEGGCLHKVCRSDAWTAVAGTLGMRFASPADTLSDCRFPGGPLEGPNSFRRGRKTVPGGPWGVLWGPCEALGTPWGPLGGPWGGPWGSRGGPWGVLGGPWGVPGGPWGVPGGPWRILGGSLSPQMHPEGVPGHPFFLGVFGPSETP